MQKLLAGHIAAAEDTEVRVCVSEVSILAIHTMGHQDMSANLPLGGFLSFLYVLPAELLPQTGILSLFYFSLNLLT